MRTLPAVLASACLCGLATTASAQSMNEMMNRMERMMQQSTAVKAAEREWARLPKDELACATQKLTERGDSVQSLARKGVLPSDPRVADIRTQCATAKAAPSTAQPATQSKSEPETSEPGSSSQPVPADVAPRTRQMQPSSEAKATESESLAELKQTIEKLQTDLSAANSRIAQLQRENAATELTSKQAEQAKLDAQDARRELEQARTAETADLKAALAKVVSDKGAAEAESARRERLAYGGILGLLAVMAALTAAFFMSRQKARVLEQRLAKQQALEPASTTAATIAQAQGSKGGEAMQEKAASAA
jgi:DNA repair exonuclease SbcCD ATPase subunit